MRSAWNDGPPGEREKCVWLMLGGWPLFAACLRMSHFVIVAYRIALLPFVRMVFGGSSTWAALLGLYWLPTLLSLDFAWASDFLFHTHLPSYYILRPGFYSLLGYIHFSSTSHRAALWQAEGGLGEIFGCGLLCKGHPILFDDYLGTELALDDHG